MMKAEIPECDHTPDGTMVGHIELWAVKDGFVAMPFVRGRVLPEVIAECEDADDPLCLAGEMLSAEMEELSR